MQWQTTDTVRSIAGVRRNTGVIKHILGTKHKEHGKKTYLLITGSPLLSDKTLRTLVTNCFKFADNICISFIVDVIILELFRHFYYELKER